MLVVHVLLLKVEETSKCVDSDGTLVHRPIAAYLMEQKKLCRKKIFHLFADADESSDEILSGDERGEHNTPSIHCTIVSLCFQYFKKMAADSKKVKAEADQFMADIRQRLKQIHLDLEHIRNKPGAANELCVQ